ncbi:MucBP domain-containing protein [Latilactobacillus sakei]|uniref:MucBP domain-containing protein n=1 Tax=Latilactobacillus sakei TaxID=1599 RepID=UPI0020C7AE0C|nr:MucBP domain-containing protein [Latilactobacillus sakei]MCP8854197.1 MucBP domain-containing protein [Latilactobacillus sakei]
MNFINLIQSLFRRRPKRPTIQPETHFNQATPEPENTNQFFETADEFEKEPQAQQTEHFVTTPVQPRKSSVTIHYLNQNRIPLRPSITLSGVVGATLDLPWLKFPGYYLAEITNLKQHFHEDPTNIWLFYKPQLAAPVMVLHQDLEGGLLIKPQFLLGALNEHYQANPLEGGVNFIYRTSSNQTGRFSAETQLVRFQYDPLNLKYSDAPDQPFIELTASVDTYKRPTEETLTTTRLPKNAIWKIYSCATATSGQQWFNLGSFWISPKHYELHATNPKATVDYQVPKFTNQYTIIETTPLNLDATLNNTTATLWAAPYEKPATYCLALKTRVHVKQVIALDNLSRWCELEGGQWLLESLLTFD